MEVALDRRDNVPTISLAGRLKVFGASQLDAALGANYVNISHASLFTETPPYKVDQIIRDNLLAFSPESPRSGCILQMI